MLLWQTIHGHLALLGLALCLHPVLGLRRRKKPSRGVAWSGALATGTTGAVSALGWLIYPAYRQELRGPLYGADVRLGLAFEVKEHLAFFALLLTLAGAALLWQGRGAHGARLRASIMACYGLAAALTAVVCTLGVWLAVTKGFAYPL